VGNAGGVFQADGVCVFPIALPPTDVGELGWRSVAETAVWPLLIVVLLPGSDLTSCVEQVHEPVHPQAFFPQSSVKALHVRVRTARWVHCYEVVNSRGVCRQKKL
jgi:hypothetical protein